MNWKARLHSKMFWIALMSLFIYIVKALNLFTLPNDIDVIVNTVIGFLVTLGVIVDPTTPGIYDKVYPPDQNR